MVEPEMIDLDVLVVGGGGAGAMAAIWAAREVEKVGIAEKGVFGKSGCTPLGAFSINVAFGYADPADSPRSHLEDTVKGGKFINNQELVDIYTREAPERIEELISYGAKFDMEGGKLHQALMDGHSYPRSVHFDWRSGPMIMGTMVRKIRKTPRIRVFEEVIIVDLRITAEGPHYAIGFRWADSAFLVFKARAIVVTTGGGAQIYKNHTTSLDNTGDGISLMYQAGAVLGDMEFVQFYPTTACFPKLPGLNPTGPAFLRIRTGARLYNALGEEFANREMPGWRYQATRDILSQAIYREIMEGRGTPHGGVYMDVSHLPAETIRKEYAFGNFYHLLLRIGVDIAREPIETKVSAHFFMGGARVNAKGETSLAGLFSGGEAVAGYHGANRLGGNALSEILVSGSRAGKFAALWGKENPGDPDREAELKSRLDDLRGKVSHWKQKGSGLRPAEGRKRIQELMWEKAGVIREKSKLESGLASLISLQREMEENLVVCPVRRYNREILEAFELGHMLRVSSLIFTAALAREESRGSHYRIDFPFPDDEKWLVNILLQKSGEEATWRKEKVKLTHLRPEG